MDRFSLKAGPGSEEARQADAEQQQKYQDQPEAEKEATAGEADDGEDEEDNEFNCEEGPGNEKEDAPPKKKKRRTCLCCDKTDADQDARDPEVLSLMATIVNTCKDAVTPRVPEVLAAVFECTLQMITANFEDFPDIRCGE